MNTTIIIPGKVQKVQPKPTKSQIAEALLKRARVAHQKEVERIEAEVEKLKIQLETETRKLIKNIKSEDFEIDTKIHRYNEDREMECTVKIINPQLRALRKKIAKMGTPRFDEDATKKKIREGLAAPNPLLGDDSINSALDQLLAKVMGYTPVIEA